MSHRRAGASGESTVGRGRWPPGAGPDMLTRMPTPGAEIRAVRTRAGLSLAELGRRADLSVGSLSRLENDRHLPTWSTLVRIATALECEPQLKLVPARA